MSNRPSKYHQWSYLGSGAEGANESGYGYRWDSAEESLKPSTVYKISNTHYCVYCLAKALPIQAGLRRDSNRSHERRYDTTGYMCICDAAESERDYHESVEEMKSRHYKETLELKEFYKDKLLIDDIAILRKIQEVDLRNAERNGKDRQDSFFDQNYKRHF